MNPIASPPSSFPLSARARALCALGLALPFFGLAACTTVSPLAPEDAAVDAPRGDASSPPDSALDAPRPAGDFACAEGYCSEGELCRVTHLGFDAGPQDAGPAPDVGALPDSGPVHSTFCLAIPADCPPLHDCEMCDEPCVQVLCPGPAFFTPYSLRDFGRRLDCVGS